MNALQITVDNHTQNRIDTIRNNSHFHTHFVCLMRVSCVPHEATRRNSFVFNAVSLVPYVPYLSIKSKESKSKKVNSVYVYTRAYRARNRIFIGLIGHS